MNKYAMECIDRSKAMRQLYGFMTPDYVATLAYNAHTAGPMGQNNPITKSIAADEVELFKGLTSSLDSAGGIFLHKVRLEFNSLANAISECKREYIKHVDAIIGQYSEPENKVKNQWLTRATWRAIYRFATVSGFAAMGASIARALIPVFSAETAANTGELLPTLGAAGLAAWVGYALTEWWNEYRRNSVAEAKQLKLRHARREHDKERLNQIIKHLERLHSIWYTYTGIEYWVPVDASYARIIQDDMDTMEQLQREFDRQMMSPIRLFVATCLAKASKLRRKNDKGIEELPAFLPSREAGQR